jgi:uncharacterized protein YxjI
MGFRNTRLEIWIVLGRLSTPFLLMIGMNLCEMLYANCPTLELPKRFFIRETLSSGVTPFVYDFEILDTRDRVIGSIENRVMRLTSTQQVFNTNHELVAEAEAQYVSWGTDMKVLDCQGKRIGKIREDQVVGRIASAGSIQTLDIQDAEQNKIAEASKLDTSFIKHIFVLGKIVHILGFARNSEFKIENNSGTNLAHISRSFAQPIRDTWELDINKTDEIDPLMLIFLPVYRTRVDSPFNPKSSATLKRKRQLFEMLYQESALQ